MKIIARIYNDFSTKFAIPRQSGLVEGALSRIVFEPEYRNPDALRGIEDFSHLWLLWEFSEFKNKEWSPTVRPPRLGGNERIGVFATRSPHRPNSIGLSSVKLVEVIDSDEGRCLVVSGADLMNKTPIYDIKPYLSYTDSHPEAKGGFTDRRDFLKLRVQDPDKLLDVFDDLSKETVIEILSLDPRPAYHNDPERIYGFEYGCHDIRFRVDGESLVITTVEKIK